MSDKSELKAELERKKLRLAQIREEKKRKEEERKKKEAELKKEVIPLQDDSDLEKKRREAEALLQSMGITTDVPMVPAPLSPTARSVGTPSEAGSQDSGDGATGPRTLHWDCDPSTVLLHSEFGRAPVKLGMTKMTHVDFPPKEVVSYTKETQTPTASEHKDARISSLRRKDLLWAFSSDLCVLNMEMKAEGKLRRLQKQDVVVTLNTPREGLRAGENGNDGLSFPPQTRVPLCDLGARRRGTRLSQHLLMFLTGFSILVDSGVGVLCTDIKFPQESFSSTHGSLSVVPVLPLDSVHLRRTSKSISLVDCSGLAGGERAVLHSGSGLKDTDYCFPPSLIEALERKDFNLLSPLFWLSTGLPWRDEKVFTKSSQAETPVPSPCHRTHRHNPVQQTICLARTQSCQLSEPPAPALLREIESLNGVSVCSDGLNASGSGSGSEEEEEEEVAAPQPEVEMETEKPVETHEEEAPRELSEEEKQQILHSAEFMMFFDHSSRIVERALSEHVDVLFDYSGRDMDEKEGEMQAGSKLSLNRKFVDDRWSKQRVVTCLDWSPQYPELLVASYNNNEEAPHEPDGAALVWNMKYKKNTPEYVFHCQSAVMSATFTKFHPNLVVGGTYSGQIVLWDNRSNRRTPVQRTPLSAAAHTHPVYCVNVVGTQNAHNLISISTDGRMCSWSLDMLSQPQDSMELVFKQSKSVAVTSMSFPLGDVNNFVVGSEDGSVYTASPVVLIFNPLPSAVCFCASSRAGISEVFEGHHGPITGIHCHTAAGPVDFSHLFLTASFDWTLKLWSNKNNKPLYSFEDNSDYVYDVMWSPVHPALFACVDGLGRIDLWNLNNDTEVPTASVTVTGAPALNRLRWSQSGREIAVGDSEGQIHIYDVGEQIAVPRNDEWTRFVRTLAEINENREDAEELATQRLSV
ncbi:hypothetical protein DNTS_011815 [Danionella cerebrum]|uniref:Uncharacterized protein n=1 Tax=Danionella cerebrum TaxID=2873325 RepID=A0A553QKJ4_9TELE|nr:hypothetical protein DNTS_011815 [Danionella translucida]